VYYSAGLASLTAFAAADELPHTTIFWLVARLLLDTAGGLFALYLVAIIGLLLTGAAMRRFSALPERPAALTEHRRTGTGGEPA
jgi:hypothetical protein